MISRRGVLTALGGVAVAGGGFGFGSYSEALTQIDSRLHGQSSVIATTAGTME